MTGDDLRAYREQISLPQVAMAALFGMSLRAYQSLETNGKALSKRHRLVAERVSLRLAVVQKDLNRALPAIRRDALDYAELMRGERMASLTDAIEKAKTKAKP